MREVFKLFDRMHGRLTSGTRSIVENERLEIKKLCKLIVHEVGGLVQHIAHIVQNVVKHYLCATVITTSSELDIGRINSKNC